MVTKKRLGRPPDTTSDETRQRILDAARDCFSRNGFDKTTNKDIAQAADITTGAIYHYFDSKQALYAAVAAEVARVVFDAFDEAVADQPTFLGRISAVLDAASRLHADDHSLARFSATNPIELQRHPELIEFLDPDDAGRVAGYFTNLAAEAAAAGELPPGISAEDMGHLIGVLTLGLAYYGALTPNLEEHRATVIALQRLLSQAFDGPAPAQGNGRKSRR